MDKDKRVEVNAWYSKNCKFSSGADKESHREYFIAFITAIEDRIEGKREGGSVVFLDKIIKNKFEGLETTCRPDSPRIKLIPLFKLYHKQFIQNGNKTIKN